MRIFILLFSAYTILLSKSCIDINKIYQGETHEGLRKEISEDLKKELVIGLENYKKVNGLYPISTDKYYLKYLSKYVNIPKVYIYFDKIENGKVVTSYNYHLNPKVQKFTKDTSNIKQNISSIDSHELPIVEIDSIDTSNLYIGCGSRNERIVYKSVDGKSYTLDYVIEPIK